MVAAAEIAASSAGSDSFRVVSWQLVKEECQTDATSLDLVTMICSGFPESRTDVPDHLKVFWPMRHELHQLEGVPFHDKKMYIPQSLRAEVLDCLHSAHQGEVGMKNSARHRHRDRTEMFSKLTHILQTNFGNLEVNHQMELLIQGPQNNSQKSWLVANIFQTFLLKTKRLA